MPVMILAGRLVGAVFILATFLLGLPFAGHGTVEWHEMGGKVLVGTLLVAAVSFAHAVASASLLDAVLLAAITVAVSWAGEAQGVQSGGPFGCTYHYQESLRPYLPGNVPLIIPVAWYVLLRLPLILMDDWAIPRKADGRPSAGCYLKALVCGTFMAGCGLLLDPLGAVLGAWTWSHPDGFMAVQVGNAAGWMVIGFLSSACYLRLRPAHGLAPSWLRRLDVDIVVSSILFHTLAIITVGNRVHVWLPAISSTVLMIPAWWIWLHCRFFRNDGAG